MSLIKVRRRRKKNWLDARKGMSSGRLVLFLVLVGTLIWLLGRF